MKEVVETLITALLSVYLVLCIAMATENIIYLIHAAVGLAAIVNYTRK